MPSRRVPLASLRDASSGGARISNNSWGYGDFGRYGPDSREYDAHARDARPSQPGNQETTLHTFPGSPVNDVDSTFGFSSPDADASFECRLDGAAYAACTSLKHYTGLTAGTQTFKVQAIDGSGNESLEESLTWTIDPTPPETLIHDGPAALVQSLGASFDFSSGADASLLRMRGSARRALRNARRMSARLELEATDSSGATRGVRIGVVLRR